MFEPEASAQVRTVVYWIAFVATVLTVLATAVVLPTWPDHAAIIMLWITSVNAAIDAVAVGLAVRNRPTRFPVAQTTDAADKYGRHASPQES